MAVEDSDSILLALLIILQYEVDDPFLRKAVYDRLRSRLRKTEFWSSDIDELVFSEMLHNPRGGRRREEARDIAVSVVEGFRQEFDATIGERISRTEDRLNELSDDQALIQRRIDGVVEDARFYRDEFHSYLWLVSSGGDIREAKITRYVPARIYLSDPVPRPKVLDQITTSIEDLLADDEFEKADDFPEETGSWWKRLVFKTKQYFSHHEVQDRLEKAERAVQVATLDKPQAEANEHQANAASKLITSLESTSNACIQVGTLLVVKATNADGDSAIVSRTLTPKELKKLEENQAMLRRPNEILEWLQTQQTMRLTNR